MRIGDTVVRVKEEHNLRKIGDIAVIDGLKIYNKGVCVHLEGDKPDTWHAESNYRNIEDVDMPYLQAKLAHVVENLRLGGERLKALKKDRKMPAIEILDKTVGVNEEPEDDLIHDLLDTETQFDQTEEELDIY